MTELQKMAKVESHRPILIYTARGHKLWFFGNVIFAMARFLKRSVIVILLPSFKKCAMAKITRQKP